MSTEKDEAAVVGARSRAIAKAMMRAGAFAAGVPTDHPIPDESRALMLVALGTVVGALIAGMADEAKGQLLGVVVGAAGEACANIEQSMRKGARHEQ